MALRSTALIGIAAAFLVRLSLAEGPAPGEVVSESYSTGDKDQKDLTLYLRQPRTVPQGEPVEGVLAICKYGERDLEMDLTGGARHFGYLIRFADQKRLAVVGFGQPAKMGWNKTISTEDLDRREASRQDRNFDSLARDWSRTMTRFARKYDLPDRGWLLYGICGGAQYAHRLALRQPQHFKAVHVHWGGSYDVPTPAGRELLWLVTTWADEPAYVAAQHFYRACRELDYPIILKGHHRKGIPGERGRGDFGEGVLAAAFFDYALRHSGPARYSPEYIADFVNEMVVPAGEGAWIPAPQAVWLPNRTLAEAWGPIEE